MVHYGLGRYKRMMRKTALISLALGVSAAALPAQAQIRVDARIHSSSGSCAQCDLSNKRMNGVKLKNANFSGSTFNNSNLSGGNFDGSNLTGSHFRKAMLYGVEGKNVNLNGANLEDATLIEAKLGESVFIGTDFSRADLTRGEFGGGDFRQTSLQRAVAAQVDFKNTNFADAKLDHINLHRAALDGAKFNNVSFGTAIMLDASVTGTDFSDADLSQTQGLSQEQLNEACGNANTRLPNALSIPYCEGSLIREAAQDRNHLSPDMVRAATRLDSALSTVEGLLETMPRTDKTMRRQLERIHADIAKSKRAIEK